VYSSKVFAMANAAGHLRTNETQCEGNRLFGLDGSVTGKNGVTELGDLATIICSYDTTAGYSSNSLSSYFHDIGWRGRANGLVQDWLLAGSNSTFAAGAAAVHGREKGDDDAADPTAQSLGGNYGEATPSDLTRNVAETTPTGGK
jgi:hypothetical protein